MESNVDGDVPVQDVSEDVQRTSTSDDKRTNTGGSDR